MSHYLILNTLMSTYDDEVNEKGGIRGANHKIDELSRVESSRVESSRVDDLVEAYRINANSTAIENRERPMIIRRKRGSFCWGETLNI